MSRGQKQQNGSSNGHGQQQTMQKRGNRTLGWYLGVQQNNGGNGPDEVEDNLSNQQPMRKISLEDSRSSAKFNNGEEQQRKSHRQHRCSQYQQQQMTRPRANSSASASKKPLNAIGGNQQPIHPGDISKDNSQIQQQNDFQKSAAKAMSGKENYWYYDLVSDGYYYEHNGTRGWRKRNAKLDAAIQNVQKGIEDAKIAEQQKKIVESAKAPLSLNVPSLMTGQQQSGKFGNIANNGGAAQFGNPMAIKYFDNDGYFYEMASVDGWRRRQPGLTPPNSLASSFGAAQPKAPSPINVPRRKIQPLQYQAYQQPPPQLNNLDLQEMIIMAQQQQNRNAGQHQHQNAVSCCCTQTQCCANSAAPACCTTIAAMAAQLVLQKQQQMMAENPSEFANKVKPLLEGLSNKSSASVGSSLHESKSSNRLVHSQLASNLTNNWQQFQHPGKWTPLGLDIAKNTNDEEKTTITVGSFDEPYEFYWSGDEASSEVVPKANAQQCDFIVGVPAATNINAASVSSTDEEGLEEMIKRSTKKRQSLIAPIGSETSAYGTNKKIDEKRRSQGESMQMKRPDTLKLTCQKPMNEPYVPISPGEIVMNPFGKENAAQDIMSSSHNFDVDKFISQLPPMPVNPEQILHSLRNPLRTPIGPPPSSMIEPSTADSPLFTPIHLGKNPWTYRLPENPWAYP